jgi:hypothetical protein
MTKPAAFRATYSDWKLVKTRQVVQIVFEVPLADADAAYDVIGGMPDPSKERWFGIAPINTEAVQKPKRDWRDMPPTQQAGIRCDDPMFAAFLKEQHPDDWREAENAANFVRGFCGVASRSELVTNHKARVRWHQLDEQFQAWKQVEHA